MGLFARADIVHIVPGYRSYIWLLIYARISAIMVQSVPNGVQKSNGLNLGEKALLGEPSIFFAFFFDTLDL